MQYFVVVLALIKVDFLMMFNASFNNSPVKLGKNLIWWPWPLTLNINRFQILLRTKYVPSLVKVHWRMLILECSQGYYAVKILIAKCRSRFYCTWFFCWCEIVREINVSRVGDYRPKGGELTGMLANEVATKLGQSPLKDVDSRVFTRMLHGKKFTQWPWPLTYDLENQ
jgi:hypothetical protein